MKQQDIREILVARFKSHYKATVSSKSVKKMSDTVKRIQVLEFPKKEICKYVDYCMEEFQRTTTDRNKLSSVNYFAAIVANHQSLKKYLDRSLRNDDEIIEISYQMKVILVELGVLFRANPNDADMKRIHSTAKVMESGRWTDEEISDYIDYCVKIFNKMVKDPVDRSNVSNFTRFFTSTKMLLRYADYKDTKESIKRENPIETDDEDDDSTMHIGGHTYYRIKKEEDREIFFCPILVRFLIKDYSGMVPKIYRLSQYNKHYPENLITTDTVKGLIKGGKILCLI